MRPPTAAGRDLHADPYHAGVRFGTLGLWVLACVGLYLLAAVIVQRWLGDLGASWLIIMALVLLVSQPLARWIERQLIRYWSSGRTLRLEPQALVFTDRQTAQRFELTNERVNFWRWYFIVKGRRNTRVKTGDHVCALRLVQGEQVASFYAFVPKADAEALQGRLVFYHLQRSADKASVPLGGREAVYVAAEQARWESGAELNQADFEALLDHLAAHLPNFKNAPSS